MRTRRGLAALGADILLIGTFDINHSSSIVALLDNLGHDITPFEFITKILKVNGISIIKVNVRKFVPIIFRT